MSPMQTRCVAHFELFESYVRAGFTRPEALDLVIAAIHDEHE